MASRVDVPLTDQAGAACGKLRISELPHLAGSLVNNEASEALLDQSNAVCLLESKEYRYEWILDVQGTAIITDRPELFVPDDSTGRTGRLKTGLYVGTLPVRVSLDGHARGRCAVEVASAKLNYLSDYRWMLRDIAVVGAGLLSSPFAPTEQRYRSSAANQPSNAYTELRFILSQVSSPDFRGALRRVLERPYLSWVEVEESASSLKGLPAGYRAVGSFLRPGVRVAAPQLSSPLREFGVPKEVSALRSCETPDNAPNRFVRQTLQNWLARCYAWTARLPRLGAGARMRGTEELEEAITFLEEALSHEVFAAIRSGEHAGRNSTVLQQRAGYREILAAALTVDAAVELAWSGAADVFGGGQKNVAVLFEYWCYLQIVDSLARAFDVPRHEVRATGLTSDSAFNLSRDTDARASIETQVNGRQILIDAFFNRSFGKGGSDASSWTQVFRPDVSVRLRAVDSSPIDADGVWIHFDAKYRVDRVDDVFGEEPVEGLVRPLGGSSGKAVPDDLAKMHTYRDAIRRSAGAFVLYPGTIEHTVPQYSELLPGLGAFPLRPSSDGSAHGTAAIQKFLRDTAVHFASQFSRHHRGRFWERESYQGSAHTVPEARWASFLSRPPSDTRVLVGFVRDRAHIEWIRRTRRYNLRADDRSGTVGGPELRLDFDLVLLHCPSLGSVSLWKQAGAVELRTREQMIALGYPRSPGTSYLCVPLGDELSGQWVSVPSVEEVASVLRARYPALAWGAPAVLRFDELEKLRAASSG